MRYDPILCMMVDDSVKTKDAESYGKYKLPNGEIVEVIDRKNVHGADTIVYKNSRGVHFATVDWFMSNAKKVYDSASALDEAIKTCDAVDVDRISNYLWLWVEGREVTSALFNEGLDKYSGPHDKEHKDEAYDFAKKYAQKELDALYSKLKSSVEKKLKEGYTNTKNYISGAR